MGQKENLAINWIYMNLNDLTVFLVLALETFHLFWCNFIERRITLKTESKIEWWGLFNSGRFVLGQSPVLYYFIILVTCLFQRFVVSFVHEIITCL